MADNVAVVEQVPPALPTSLRPRAVNSNIYTIDITNRFQTAASSLAAGTLIKDEHFTLFESVGALEIGDPKMDSGCVIEGESLDDEFDTSKPLRLTEIIWLMDELLSREVAWHMGYPLSQTLFTSVYIERLLWPDPLRLDEAQFSPLVQARDADPMLHKLFRSYCLGLIKSCDLVLGMVTGQHYYEEEDLATQLYNRELLHRFTVDDILADMRSALQNLQGTALEQSLKQNLEARMSFRLQFLKMLSSHTTIIAASLPHEIVDESLLPQIQTSISLGTPVAESFTLKIQHRLASTVPPRPMVTIDEHRTFDYLKHFIRDCENAHSVLNVSHSQDLLTTYSIFSAQDPQPSVYVRALLQSWLGHDYLIGGISNELDFIIDDMQAITLAASPVLHAFRSNADSLTKRQKAVKQHLHDFLGKNGRSFLNLWRTTCLNRCRVRRTLCHAALEWDQIQAEAEELDDELQSLTNEKAIVYPIGGIPTYSYSLSSWVYHYKLIQLRFILQIGFELDVYAPYEMASMYWYLGHICDTHLAHLERISSFISQREAALAQPRQRSSYEAKEIEESQTTLRHLYRQFSWLKATEATARALHCFYIVLQRNGQLQQSSTTYASDDLRYEIRMRPFLHLSVPEPLSFEQFRRLCQMEVRNDTEILDEAASYITVAKKGWEEVLRANWHSFSLKHDTDNGSTNVIEQLWNSDVRGAVKATIGCNIAISALRKYLQRRKLDETLPLRATIPKRGEKDNWHSCWRVPRVAM